MCFLYWLTYVVLGCCYLHQGGCVIVIVCLSVCLFLLATLRKNFGMDLHEIFRECWQWGPMNKWLNFGGNPDHATLIKRAFAEVCTVPMLLVVYIVETLYTVLVF